MSFISLEFLAFFTLIFIIFFQIKRSKQQNLLLLGASYFFYGYWNISYLVLIFTSTLIDYFAGRLIAQTSAKHYRKALLLLSVGTNLGILFIFKYFNFFADSLSIILDAWGIGHSPFLLNVLLPVGISFYTFQSMSYTIDIYYGRQDAETKFVIFATYVSFFPQLVAGPIERAGNMLAQFQHSHNFDYERVISGLRLILWGAFKKVVVSDLIAVYVNAVFNDVSHHHAIHFWIATIFFTMQIYCDFSGYSDIAIGTARILGFDLMTNFRQPYFSYSIREFWQRWHISLSTWFRDYLYVPLGGNRVSFGKHLRNLMIVFVVSGLWHGASWTFVVWGALHGIVMVIETVYHKIFRPNQTHTPLWRWVMTLCIVMLGWIFFRANTVHDALYIMTHLIEIPYIHDIFQPFDGLALRPVVAMGLSIMGISSVMLIDRQLQYRTLDELFVALTPRIRHLTYHVLVGCIVFFWLIAVDAKNFIYFQF